MALALGAVPAMGATLTTLHAFGTGLTEGTMPGGTLVLRSGILYGTTQSGGAAGFYGTLFKTKASTGATSTLYNFVGKPDGSNPQNGVIFYNGLLYGTNYLNGMHNGGDVFAINPATGAETLVYNFIGGSDGIFPHAGVTLAGTQLYGTTNGGGGASSGTVYRLDPATGQETVLYRFSGGADGREPAAAPLYSGGSLYGTAQGGGSFALGVIYRVNTTSHAESTLYSFAGQPDGRYPLGTLAMLNGNLYGITPSGGDANLGVVFQFNTRTGTMTILHSFAGGSDGAYPLAGLTLVNGVFYGTTSAGGGADCGGTGCGTLFSIVPATSAETVLASFAPTAAAPTLGATPFGPLLYAAGVFYGTTAAGGGTGCGGAGCGSIFKFTP